MRFASSTYDQENRLTRISYSNENTGEFSYDGYSRRVRMVERDSAGTTTTDKRFLWSSANQPSEERDTTGSTVLKQFYAQGVYVPAATRPANKQFYTKDHLGNIRELFDNNQTVLRYSYDAWGRRTKLSGTGEADFGYTGHYQHAASDLTLTWYRDYDADLGRWLSRDPLREGAGIALYGYVLNDPVNNIDPKGLEDFDPNNNIAEVINCQQVCVELAKSVPCPDAFLKKCLQNCLDGIYPSPIDIIETPTTKPSIPNNPLKWVKFVCNIVKKIIKGE